MKKYYYNLTNGLEFEQFIEPYSFIRIQSTACEQKKWNFIIQDLDNDFLFNVSIGTTCIICDLSEKKEETRALYQGLEWITFVLTKRWLAKKYMPMVRDNDTFNYFDYYYHQLAPQTKRKLDYFKRFLKTDTVCINKIFGNIKTYKELNHGNINNN